MKIVQYLQLVVIISLLQIAACNNDSSYSGMLAKEAPGFSLPTTDSVQVRLQDFKGKKILLHFWADWCASCRAEFPKLQQAYLHLKSDSFEIVAVNAGQSSEHVQEFIDEYDITFPMLVDEQAEVAKQYEVRGLPMNFIVNEDGRIEKILLGWLDESMIRDALDQSK